jgi:integrase
VAHATVDKDLAVLKAFFGWCIARNLTASNPVCRGKFFNEDNSRLRYLKDDEYSRLLQAAKKIETSPFLAEKIILSVHTGLRRGSLFHLRWDQVDFLNRVLRIVSKPCDAPGNVWDRDSSNRSNTTECRDHAMHARSLTPAGGAQRGR